jgi:hypothetical protein
LAHVEPRKIRIFQRKQVECGLQRRDEMRITTYGLRTRILAMFASTTLVGVGCGGSTDSGGGTGGTSTGGTGGSGATGATGATGGGGATGGVGGGSTGGVGGGSTGGAGGYGAGGAGGATGGAAGVGATGGGGATGGSAGQAGAGGEGGLIIKGTVDCQSCVSWESCWKKGEVPTVPGAPDPDACPSGGYVDLTDYPYCDGNVWIAGGTEENGLCCYMTNTCVVGRPLVVAGEIRTAPSVLRSDWMNELELDANDLDDFSRARLTEEWLNDGRLEHASVAAFARLTLELMALGAPPELVRGAQESSIDEIEHAQLCFGIAARISGKAMGPGKLPVHGALSDVSLAEMARATFEEGCVGETIAALVAAAQARAARSGSLARIIEKIAEDESRHAAFAWRVVRWAIAVGGREVRNEIEKSFERIMTTSAVPASTGIGQDRSAYRAFGRIDGDEAARVRAEALRDVIAPCVRALLAESAAAAA